MNNKDHFLIGWLDALWSTFDDEACIATPPDVSRQLVRRGWLKPVGSKHHGEMQAVEITPLGIRMVKEANEAFEIKRSNG